MEMIINEISSKVSAVDSDALLNPETLQKIVRIVLEAVEERDEYLQRLRIEQHVTPGVRQL